MKKKIILLLSLVVICMSLTALFTFSTSAATDGDHTVSNDESIITDGNDIILGDINGDGAITILDVSVLVRIVSGDEAVDYYASPDINGDGSVTILDIAALIKIAAGEQVSHALTYHASKAASCTEDGNIEYWSCSDCGKLYADSQGEREITLAETVVKAAHTGETEIRNQKNATEYQDGYSGDVYCLECGEMISAGVVLPHTSQMPAIIVSDVFAEADTVSVVISIVNNPGIVSLNFSVLYGSSLSIQSVKFSDAFGSYVTTPEPYINPQLFNWITFGENEFVNGEFVTITFSVNPDAMEGETAEIRIIPNNQNIFDYDLNQIQFDSVGTTITIDR